MIMDKHILVNFGFGPIGAGLFVNEAFGSGKFRRIVIAEIDQQLVDAVRKNNGSYFINVAGADGIEITELKNVEMLNPNVDSDRKILLEALAQATEIVTCLPAVSFYTIGQNNVAGLIAEALQNDMSKPRLIYAAENNNYAAEILKKTVGERLGTTAGVNVQFLNTVIGKMSGTVTDEHEISQRGLKPIAPGIGRAFLVEEFNRILVSRCTLPGFRPGIEVFIEKDDLMPFEEAKLFGHNAIHSLLAYLGAAKGYKKMEELKNDTKIMAIATAAFLDESGAALVKKYHSLGDELFTEAGYKNYADDLLERMVNPYLADTIARAGRDPVRKLALNDRIFGTMQIILAAGIEPVNMALAAAAGITVLLADANMYNIPDSLRVSDWRKLSMQQVEKILLWLWEQQQNEYSKELIRLVQDTRSRFADFVES